MFGNFGGSNIMWILILLLVLGNDGESGGSCNTLIWLLLLSKYCGGDCGCTSCNGGCSTCGTTGTRSCGCI